MSDYVSSRDLVKKVADDLGVSVYSVESMITALGSEAAEALKDGKTVKIRGLVKLSVQRKKDRIVYSPYDHRKITVPAHDVIRAESAVKIGDDSTGEPV
jgi:nucleoid DNA-binding protein